MGSVWITLYLNGLLIGGVVCLFLLAYRYCFRGAEYREGKVLPWRVRWLDFGFLLWLLFFSVVLSRLVADSLAMYRPAVRNESGIWDDIVAGFAMHAMMFAIFAYFLSRKDSRITDPINAAESTVNKALATGIFTLFAAVPAIAAVGIGWQYCVFLLKSWGLDLPNDPQPLVEVLSNDLTAVERSLLVLMAVVTAPIVEELIFRGCIYRFLKARYGAIFAMFCSSLVFGLIHFNISSLPSLIVLGIFLCISYERAGNIMAPIFFHALFNMNSVILIFALDDIMLDNPW